jgi:excinuclease ABC subunit A
VSRQPERVAQHPRTGPGGARIEIRGARQNNLRSLDLDVPLNALTVVTGVSGSGKTSLAFQTLYAEGQRRYVETFSPYARQFLSRMARPDVDRVDHLPPALAIRQGGGIRSSRSTVGTMTDLAELLRALYARTARLYCRGCGRPVAREDASSVAALLARERPGQTILVAFPITAPQGLDQEVRRSLDQLGYRRIVQAGRAVRIEEAPPPLQGRVLVVQDRLEVGPQSAGRLGEALEQAFRHGRGRLVLIAPDGSEHPHSQELHCAFCDLRYEPLVPRLLSFGNALGACPRCRGFGRTIEIDLDLVVPDPGLSLKDGAIRPWRTESYEEWFEDLQRFCAREGIPLDRPWKELTEEQRHKVYAGDGKRYWGIKGFFDWQETRTYKMHIRVLLARYRTYKRCTACGGTRLRPEALLWRTAGRHIAEAGALPIGELLGFLDQIAAGVRPEDAATRLALEEVRSRAGLLDQVGLGYLSLDREAKTLSGGELQRVHLTAAVGSSLSGALYVLDEPSIGLHPRDLDRLVRVLYRLRDNGNTVVVVEHDPQIIAAADHLIDLGPGPGERGGHIVYAGPAKGLDPETSLTGRWLAAGLDGKLASGAQRSERRERTQNETGDRRPELPTPVSRLPSLTVRNARQHNLKGLSVAIPLGRLVAVSGVSGSGKSTLVEDVLFRNALRHFGEPASEPGLCDGIDGLDQLAGVELIDQSPVVKSPRSIPATATKAFDGIRKLFAEQQRASRLKLSPAHFSFNSPRGRCKTCEGSGHLREEMQFLSDVFLPCPDCEGRRFTAKVLEVTVRGLNLAEVLDLTVTEAMELFAEERGIAGRLAPLAEVGLGYLRLGQPVSELSGGEAQRLKLASVLGERRGRRLLLLDEPTTGLHPEDTKVLLSALRRLVEAGHSVLCIEHNLQVLAACDWILDLGPEAGASGGRLLAAGTPADILACMDSPTGQALRSVAEGGWKALIPPGLRPGPRQGALPPAPPPGGAAPWTPAIVQPRAIRIEGAREHNLRGLTVELPLGRLIVVTGVSGSGKSTLAFDVLFAEGQRRYLDTVSSFARIFLEQMARPEVDRILALPPTVAIEQRTSQGGLRSTVGTQTEIYHFLRLLYAKAGVQHCERCGKPVGETSVARLAERVARDFRGRSIRVLAPLVLARKGYHREEVDAAARRGRTELRVDGRFLPVQEFARLDRFREHTLEAVVARLAVASGARGRAPLQAALEQATEEGGGLAVVVDEEGQEARYHRERSCLQCGTSVPPPDPRAFSFNSPHGWCPRCRGTGIEPETPDPRRSRWAWRRKRRKPGEDEDSEQIRPSRLDGPECSACRGARLKPLSLAVRLAGLSLGELASLPVSELPSALEAIEAELQADRARLARDLLAEVRSRVGFVREVGLGYLALGRAAGSLSGGEAQRARLAAQLGSNLRGVCYVLDEPTIGLHPRDNQRLLDILAKLRDRGNTVVVVEHDEETIRRADHVLDLGPGAGQHGGRVVAQGALADILAAPDSATGRMLLRDPDSARRSPRPLAGAAWLELRGARLHNLKDVDLRLPLGRLCAVTGVSGSGKSSLIRGVLLPAVAARLEQQPGSRKRSPAFPSTSGPLPRVRGSGAKSEAGKSGGGPDVGTQAAASPAGVRSGAAARWASLELHGSLERVLEVDQSPIGRTPRSIPATYVGIFDPLRKFFAQLPEARLRGFGPGRFSFNTEEGRCAECGGLGARTVQMSFLPEAQVPCERCEGRRFSPETLAVRYQDRFSIADVLDSTVSEALELLRAHPRIARALRLLEDTGLGYLRLGQPSPTLSGGEAQRLKLVAELARPGDRPTLYVLEEPTIGLHMSDVERLLDVLHRLVERGHTVVVIEHNLELIAASDFVVDLGPEGGEAGGRIVAAEPPAELARRTGSHTGRALQAFWTSGSSSLIVHRSSPSC